MDRRKRQIVILKKNSLAFTLIEMLVVMAIILSLATIVLGVVMKGLKRAEEVEEVSDTRQDNIITLIDTVQSGEGYDALPEHIKKGEFGAKGSE